MSHIRFSTVIAGAFLVGAALLPTPAAVVADDDDRHRFTAILIGINEVPSISTTARGTFRANLSDDGDTLHYRLSYSGLTGTVTQGHIHLGQRHTNGNIMVWLCSGTLTDPTGLAPDCPPAAGGSVEGDITAANIIQAGNQGVVAGEFEEFIRALRNGAGYANVHTTVFGGGEIRGQVR